MQLPVLAHHRQPDCLRKKQNSRHSHMKHGEGLQNTAVEPTEPRLYYNWKTSWKNRLVHRQIITAPACKNIYNLWPLPCCWTWRGRCVGARPSVWRTPLNSCLFHPLALAYEKEEVIFTIRCTIISTLKKKKKLCVHDNYCNERPGCLVLTTRWAGDRVQLQIGSRDRCCRGVAWWRSTGSSQQWSVLWTSTGGNGKTQQFKRHSAHEANTV